MLQKQNQTNIVPGRRIVCIRTVQRLREQNVHRGQRSYERARVCLVNDDQPSACTDIRNMRIMGIVMKIQEGNHKHIRNHIYSHTFC